jgi:phosphatidylinositol alpha-1,6-mannosyltransferase
MPKFLREIPAARYFIVGGGPDAERLKLLTKNLQLNGKVVFYDNVVDGQLPDFYRQCDLFVMPCRQIGADVEGFGIVYLEAALFGKPSVAGRSGGAPEAVSDGKTGIVVDPESTDEIADAIIKLLKDDNLRWQMGEAARERATDEFTWEKQINKIIDKI